MTSTVDQVTEPLAAHGEGPVWHEGWPGLRWVDMLAGDVLQLDAATQAVSRHHVGTVAAALRPRFDGGVVLALERGFAFAGADLTGVEPLGELWDDPGVRMNDGGCDPDGRFYCGSMAYSERPGAGSLYRLGTDGTVTTVLTGVTISNGLVWSPDGGTAYYVDTPTRRVDAFDYDPERGLTGRRTAVEIPEAAGAPDGMTVDAEGRLWIALWGGSAVRCYSTEGVLEDHVPLPVSRVTACAFGGPDLGELYITTSQQGVREPGAGALFRYRPGVKGVRTLGYSAR
ncbi:SMP-30/gluconolactonase/LRE family protein [Amycolatopsis sp. K13G38]|uniref:SMP-30/gluconolactonase/LRE family protein n=1 Tax=Amycolatopsis acididurans TaxID=2724524 RepID=A0ABX1JG11_9PSEU|nr:SMP-30/gluconolactonase/LRE family protein [Amycolatopsis acididurans]NKQ58694.1 SMP-30/gluconolactonase/LRE family protein [Amycolatopsis acididurans]